MGALQGPLPVPYITCEIPKLIGGNLAALDGAGYAARNGEKALTFVENHDYGPSANLVADDPSAVLWPHPRTANDIFTHGIHVHFNSPNEVQYLRLERVR